MCVMFLYLVFLVPCLSCVIPIKCDQILLSENTYALNCFVSDSVYFFLFPVIYRAMSAKENAKLSQPPEGTMF